MTINDQEVDHAPEQHSGRSVAPYEVVIIMTVIFGIVCVVLSHLL